LLVAVVGSRVALAPSRSDAGGALDADGAAWTLTGRGDLPADDFEKALLDGAGQDWIRCLTCCAASDRYRLFSVFGDHSE